MQLNERDSAMALDSREKLQQRIGELEDENKALVQKVVDGEAAHYKLESRYVTLQEKVEDLCDFCNSGEA